MDAHIFLYGTPTFCIFGRFSTWRTPCENWKILKANFIWRETKKKIQKPKKFFCSETKTAPVLNHMIIEILKIILFNCKNWNLFTSLVIQIEMHSKTISTVESRRSRRTKADDSKGQKQTILKSMKADDLYPNPNLLVIGGSHIRVSHLVIGL